MFTNLQQNGNRAWPGVNPDMYFNNGNPGPGPVPDTVPGPGLVPDTVPGPGPGPVPVPDTDPKIRENQQKEIRQREIQEQKEKKLEERRKREDEEYKARRKREDDYSKEKKKLEEEKLKEWKKREDDYLKEKKKREEEDLKKINMSFDKTIVLDGFEGARCDLNGVYEPTREYVNGFISYKMKNGNKTIYYTTNQVWLVSQPENPPNYGFAYITAQLESSGAFSVPIPKPIFKSNEYNNGHNSWHVFNDGDGKFERNSKIVAEISERFFKSLLSNKKSIVIEGFRDSKLDYNGLYKATDTLVNDAILYRKENSNYIIKLHIDNVSRWVIAEASTGEPLVVMNYGESFAGIGSERFELFHGTNTIHPHWLVKNGNNYETINDITIETEDNYESRKLKEKKRQEDDKKKKEKEEKDRIEREEEARRDKIRREKEENNRKREREREEKKKEEDKLRADELVISGRYRPVEIRGFPRLTINCFGYNVYHDAGKFDSIYEPTFFELYNDEPIYIAFNGGVRIILDKKYSQPAWMMQYRCKVGQYTNIARIFTESNTPIHEIINPIVRLEGNNYGVIKISEFVSEEEAKKRKEERRGVYNFKHFNQRLGGKSRRKKHSLKKIRRRRSRKHKK